MEEGKIFGTNHPAISWQFSGNLIVPPSPLSLSSSSSWRASDWILVKCRYEIDYNTPHVVRLCKSMFVAFAEETDQEMKSVLAPRALHCTTFKTSSIRWGIGVYLRLRESHLPRLVCLSSVKSGCRRDLMRFDLDEWPFDHPLWSTRQIDWRQWWIEIETNKLILD